MHALGLAETLDRGFVAVVVVIFFALRVDRGFSSLFSERSGTSFVRCGFSFVAFGT